MNNNNIYPESIIQLIGEFAKLPGIGFKSAQRMAFFILQQKIEDVKNSAKIIYNIRKNIKYCQICQNFSEKDICSICNDLNRNKNIICIVKDAKTIFNLEKVNEYNGLYHVLHGLISPLKNIGPNDIKINELLHRISNNKNNINEIIIAIDPIPDGETTLAYLYSILKNFKIKITRLAYGIPVGSNLEFVDEFTLAKALNARYIV